MSKEEINIYGGFHYSLHTLSFSSDGEIVMEEKNQIAKSNLETMIKIYKERRINTDFVNFQERLQDMKEEVGRLKEGNPQYNSMIDEIIREIEERQTNTYVGYLNFIYLSEISKISEKISRLKMFMSVDR